jgi:hypothetical protein
MRYEVSRTKQKTLYAPWQYFAHTSQDYNNIINGCGIWTCRALVAAVCIVCDIFLRWLLVSLLDVQCVCVRAMETVQNIVRDSYGRVYGCS